MLGVNEAIQRAISRMQLKLHDFNVQLIGTGGTTTFLIQLIQDKYQNREYNVLDYKPISCMVQFPGNEIPVGTMGTNDSTTSNNVLHMYDILPIIAYFKFEDNVKKGNLILYKIKLGDGTFQVLPLELLTPIVNATRTNVVYQEWNIAPMTDYALQNKPEFQSILEQYRNQDNW